MLSKGNSGVFEARWCLALLGMAPAGWGEEKVAVFELPDGLVAEVAAASPLVEHPIMAAFDDRGRLFVSENAGLNLKKEELAARKPNSVRMLEDTDGDGVFDRATVFADGMTFPQGALWLDGALYVMSPPSLWRLEDTDGDGVADVRKELVTGFEYTGNAADVHGPFLHPGGRIYWCHGRKGHEVHDPKSGVLVSKNKGARIWSCRPDGSDVRVFAGGGMDNPVEIDFTETGEILGTVNLFYGRPRGDVLVHWLRGGAYPRRDQETVVAEFRRTGPLLEEVENFGHVAVSGMTRYRSGHLDAGWKDGILVTHFNTQTVTRTVLEPRGATFHAIDTGVIFKVGDPDAHLTDIVEDPNGDLLVIDTGGWFRIGCPTSQIAKPEIPGAIYRIRKAGPKKAGGDPFGLKFDWKKAAIGEVVEKLGDVSHAVRGRAKREMVKRGKGGLPALEKILSSPEGYGVGIRREVVWVLGALDSDVARELVTLALDDPDETVRQVGCQVAGDRARGRLVDLLRSRDPVTRRRAAEALGQMGGADVVRALVKAAGESGDDRALEHAILYALIEIGDGDNTRRGLASENAKVRAAALVALDQMEGGDLKAGEILPFLDDADPGLRRTAIWLASRHGEWAGEIADRFGQWIGDGELGKGQVEVFSELSPRFHGDRKWRAVLGQMLVSDAKNLRLAGFRAIGAADRPEFDAGWEAAIAGALDEGQGELAEAALVALAKMGVREFDGRLQAMADDGSLPLVSRGLALRALAGSGAELGNTAFELLVGFAGADAGGVERLAVARILGSVRLTKEQLIKTAELTRHAGPVDLPLFLRAFEGTRDAEIGRALAGGLSESKGIGNFEPEELERLLSPFPAEVAEMIAPTVAKLRVRKGQRTTRIAEIERQLGDGDERRGLAVFLAGKGGCIACHRIGESGRDVGPDLTLIGRIRTGRDLLESILYPSESIARDFESSEVTLKEGTVHRGLIHRESAETIYLTDAAGEEIPLERSTVGRIEPVAESLMPEGLEHSLTRGELLDLVKFLKACQ